jgi:Cu/Ag efflux protein CusF
MRTSLITATVLAALLTSGTAFAGQSVGAITSVDEAGKSVTLADGNVYTFGDTKDQYQMLGGYMPGDVVTILWDMKDGNHAALAMSPNFSDAVTGKISALNIGEKSITLDNGAVYSFLNNDENVDIGGFQVGDDVRIIATTEGGNQVGRAIQSTYSSDMTGLVKAMDKVARTVTMEDGTIVNFENDTSASLDNFKVGDAVKVNSFKAGDIVWGTSISPANG